MEDALVASEVDLGMEAAGPFHFQCDDFGCGPSDFALPPPPRPPWLEDLDCWETCDSGAPLVSSLSNNFQDIFHSVSIIVVSSIIIVISLMLAAVLVWR